MKAKKGESSAEESRGSVGESPGLEQLVDQAVGRVLEKHVPGLRQDLVRRVLEELPADVRESSSAVFSEATPANLLKAISAIHAGATQREILRALLDNTVRYSGRAALFVIKAGAANGWQGRGFSKDDDDPIKDLALDISSGVAERAMQSRMAFAGKSSEMDPQFVSRLGGPKDDSVMVMPLVLKEKVAALVYADAGSEPGGKMDAAALELLVVAASAWLEVASLRKQAQKDGNAEPAIEKAESARPAHAAASSGSDPFSSHAPKHAMAAAAAAAAPGFAPQPEPVSAPISTTSADEFSQLSPEDADVHRKAQRFARLLTDEIKLYNQAKVAEGRKNKDLYDRLKEDIEKSRATYHKRYGNTVAASADYFNLELVHSLAEDDTSLMGANFRR
jgi:hypothetical protein